MALKMIDVEVATITMQQIEIGKTIVYYIDGIKFDRVVVEKTAYSITVQGPTNKLTLPIELSEIYQKEMTNMGRQPLPPDGTPRRRGRPPKGENVAPVDMPRSTWAPSGPAASNLTQDVRTAEQNWIQEGEAANRAIHDMPQVVPIAAAEDKADWARDTLEEILDNARNEFEVIIAHFETKLDSKVIETVSQGVKSKTCYDCINVDIDNNICGKFKLAPPMSVQCNAKKNCPDFVDCEEIPF